MDVAGLEERIPAGTSVIVPIFGFVSDVRIEVSRTPTRFRLAQRSVYRELRHDDRWMHLIPERYSGVPRTSEDVQPHLRVWDSDSVGFTRLPVGFMRGVRDLEAEECELLDTASARADITVWHTGTGIVRFHLSQSNASFDDQAAYAARMHEIISTLSRDIAGEYLQLLAAESPTVVQVHGSDDDSSGHGFVDTLGATWLLLVNSPATENSRADAARFVATSSDGPPNCWPNETRYCGVSNTYSTEIASDCGPATSVLLPVLVYNAYWVATLAHLDDDLAAAYTYMNESDNAGEYDYRITERSANEIVFDHRDVLNAMSAPHLAIWNSKVTTWRLRELETDVREKLGTIATLSQSRQLEHANDLARRSNFVVTLLTALTLVGIVTGVAAFIFLEGETRDLSNASRVSLVSIAVLISILVFVAAVKPAFDRWWDARSTD